MIEWEARPDDAKIVDIDKTYTPEGEPCQVLAKAEYTRNGEVVGSRVITIGPGWIREYFPELTDEEREERFMEVFDAIPEVPPAVLAAVTAKIPVEAFKKGWQ